MSCVSVWSAGPQCHAADEERQPCSLLSVRDQRPRCACPLIGIKQHHRGSFLVMHQSLDASAWSPHKTSRHVLVSNPKMTEPHRNAIEDTAGCSSYLTKARSLQGWWGCVRWLGSRTLTTQRGILRASTTTPRRRRMMSHRDGAWWMSNWCTTHCPPFPISLRSSLVFLYLTSVCCYAGLKAALCSPDAQDCFAEVDGACMCFTHWVVQYCDGPKESVSKRSAKLSSICTKCT